MLSSQPANRVCPVHVKNSVGRVSREAVIVIASGE